MSPLSKRQQLSNDIKEAQLAILVASDSNSDLEEYLLYLDYKYNNQYLAERTSPRSIMVYNLEGLLKLPLNKTTYKIPTETTRRRLPKLHVGRKPGIGVRVGPVGLEVALERRQVIGGLGGAIKKDHDEGDRTGTRSADTQTTDRISC
ncbi:hypothetical protein BY996DRAFT_8397636 [Phakopsora pachyrhizi]|nr:hypothetical protein BY996DRAFT_8397636 [Phakopsora pachyrhizi]